MENGDGNLERGFAGLKLNDSDNIGGSDGLFQVMKAVEAAEATIKQQVEENNRLRSELQKKNEELENYTSGYAKYQNYQSDGWGDHFNVPSRADNLVLQLDNQITGGNVHINSGDALPNSISLPDFRSSNINHGLPTHFENQFDSNNVTGSLNMIHGNHTSSEIAGFTQIMSRSMTLSTSSRNQQEGNLDSQLKYSGRDLISVSDNNTGSAKQIQETLFLHIHSSFMNAPEKDIVTKVREHEEEISQLRKHLTEFSLKESQICNEKYALEKRISYMRLAFDQQQQDLILAASKAISYRQDIMEENVRLTYALQAAQQERSTFVTSLMPLLAEYSLQPPVADAQSIVSNVKVLFRHLQEQLLVTEGKLKESVYQLAPWRSDINSSNFAQSPINPNEV